MPTSLEAGHTKTPAVVTFPPKKGGLLTRLMGEEVGLTTYPILVSSI